MTRPHYLTFLARGADIPHCVAGRIVDRCRAAKLETIHISSRSIVAAAAGTPIVACPDDCPIIIGDLYQEGQHRPLAELSAHDVAEIRSTGGRRLTSRFWGSYVGIHAGGGDGRPWLVRAPLGGLPCYFIERQEGLLVGNDVSLLLDTAGLAPIVDGAALARFLLADDVRSSETCLAGVRELVGGWRLEIAPDDIVCEETWSPWQCLDRPQLYDRDDAIGRVRDAVRHAVGATVSSYRRPLLRLSGGIDSSVVAAAWPTQETSVHAVTFVTNDASGDERHYAAAVAKRLGMTLHERFRQVADVDPTRSAAAGLPRPSARLFAQASDAITRDVAETLGCDAMVDGGGGDSVFHYAVNPRLAADCLLDPDGGAHFWPTVRAIAAMGGVTPFTVARKAWGWTWRKRSYRHRLDTRFLSPMAIASASGIVRRWPAPPAATPGVVAHVAGIALIAGAQEDGSAPRELTRCSPLLIQPVVETCLRVPSWWWVEGGFNRAVVRHAFADRLPDCVRLRRSKGTPDSFLLAILDVHHELLRAMLLDGELARMGLLDRKAVDAAFAPAARMRGNDFYRLLRLIDAEAWLRSWHRPNT